MADRSCKDDCDDDNDNEVEDGEVVVINDDDDDNDVEQAQRRRRQCFNCCAIFEDVPDHGLRLCVLRFITALAANRDYPIVAFQLLQMTTTPNIEFYN